MPVSPPSGDAHAVHILFLVEDGVTTGNFNKKNGYICKIGMPPSHPLFFRLILWNE